jgi:hypothetical protein
MPLAISFAHAESPSLAGVTVIYTHTHRRAYLPSASIRSTLFKFEGPLDSSHFWFLIRVCLCDCVRCYCTFSRDVAFVVDAGGSKNVKVMEYEALKMQQPSL